MRIGARVMAMQRCEAAYRPVSQAVLEASVGQWPGRVQAYRFARAFVAAAAWIGLVPTSFPTAGVIDRAREVELCHLLRDGGAGTLTLEAVARVVTADRIALVPRPMETVTRDMMTLPEVAADSIRESGEVVHKSPAFAAIMMRAALGALKMHVAAA